MLMMGELASDAPKEKLRRELRTNGSHFGAPKSSIIGRHLYVNFKRRLPERCII
jgi:hypothetical protein